MAVLRDLAIKHAGSTPVQFANAYRAAMLSVQNDLSSPGYAPVPSNDTDRADKHRERYVLERWGSQSQKQGGAHA
jgi:hypothetical protein